MNYQPVVMIGVGEMGGVFVRGILRLGYPVYPVTRVMDISRLPQSVGNPEMVLIAVGENDLQPVLNELPDVWRDRVVLLQNELLPKDWEKQRMDHPTIISVWFEKKKGMDFKVLMPSPAFGPKADLLRQALGTLEIPVRVLDSEDQLLVELVLKNIYILTTNICGLITNGDVRDLWDNHNELAREVANEVMDIQETLTGEQPDHDKLIQAFAEAVAADPEHMCMGRSAPARLQRALLIADEAGLVVSRLREIAAKIG